MNESVKSPFPWKILAIAIAGLAVVAAIGSGYMIGWNRGHATAPAAAPDGQSDAPRAATIWTCSMHPQIKLPKPGKCPICGMDLIPLASGGADPGPRALAMSESDRKLAEISTAPVERAFVEAQVRLVGMVDYDETRVRTVTAWVPGRLDRLYVDYTGVEVRTGDHLVQVYSPSLYKAQEELIQAKKRVDESTERSEFLRESDRRSLDSAREKLRLWGLGDDQIRAVETRGTPEDRVEINSPMAGVVIEKLRQEGEYVGEGTPIYVVADLSHVWVRLDAYESDLTWIRYGQEVTIETEAYPGEKFKGWIAFIDPVLDRKTRTIKIRVNVENEDGRLKPGMFVRSIVASSVASGGRVMDPKLAGKWISPMHPEIVKDGPGECDVCGMDLVPAEELGYAPAAGDASKPLVVPVRAVLKTGRRAVVYVEAKDTDGREPTDEEWRPTYEGREVVLGARAGGHYIVLSGLDEGDRIVVNGNFKIDSALQIEAKPSMMSIEGEEPDDGLGPLRSALAPVYSAYLTAQDALAGDDLAGARAALERMSEAVTKVDMTLAKGEAHGLWMKSAAALERSAGAAAGSEDIKGARVAFRNASNALLALEREVGHEGNDVYAETHCPMAFGDGASWLQLGAEVRNPYFGASMLTCGSVKKRHLGRGGK